MAAMRAIAAGIVALVVCLSPISTRAWGLDVHRFITKRAISGLPPGLKAYYTARAEFMSEHSVDPDMWRIVDLRTTLGEEDSNHFLDIDGLDEPRPFKGVPRDWNKYVERYGAERANRIGRLPWRTEEIYRKIVERFREAAKNPGGFGAENAVYLSAVIAHYVEDAHQPFHAVVSYDGQATNQRGIHARFETELVLRNLNTLRLTPVVIKPVPDVKEFIFETLVASESLVQSVLDADMKATAGREFYDAVYFSAFYKGARGVVERRISEAASGVASVITAAWKEAGSPALPLNRPTTPARIRR